MVSSVLCPCGGSPEPWLYMPLDPKKNGPSPYSSVVRCACGTGHLSPLPDEEEIASFYDLQSYYTHGQSHMTEVAPSFADKVLTKLAWQADKSEPFSPSTIAQSLKPDARICDLGCGHALYLKEFLELGFEVIGVEPDPSAREQAAESGVTVLEGTAEAIPSGLGSFDLVLCTHALEHCRDAKQAIENAYALTKAGGLCYIEVPNCDSEHFKTFTICSEMFDAPRHIWFFTPDSLSILVQRAGFAIMRKLFSGYCRDFSPSWRAWEKSIAERLPDLNVKHHTFPASLALFLRSFWRQCENKYDCVGLLLSRS